MKDLRVVARAAVACLALAAPLALAAQTDTKDTKQERPKLVLRAQPLVSMSPSRVVLTAEIVGGPNDFEEFYCPTVVWEWGDDTVSESTSDCEPYEAGKSAIKRRFTMERVYQRAGNYQITFRLKRRDKAIASATTRIEVRPGLRDIGY